MTPEQKAAFLITQAVCAQAEIAGMQAENADRAVRGLSPAYDETAFYAVPEKYGLYHNQVISYLQGS
jgi:hypothetical protein